jgi:hypothetical protein
MCKFLSKHEPKQQSSMGYSPNWHLEIIQECAKKLFSKQKAANGK